MQDSAGVCTSPKTDWEENIKRSLDDMLAAITRLCEAGMVDEATILLDTLQELRKSLARLRICEDGNVVMVH